MSATVPSLVSQKHIIQQNNIYKDTSLSVNCSAHVGVGSGGFIGHQPREEEVPKVRQNRDWSLEAGTSDKSGYHSWLQAKTSDLVKVESSGDLTQLK